MSDNSAHEHLAGQAAAWIGQNQQPFNAVAQHAAAISAANERFDRDTADITTGELVDIVVAADQPHLVAHFAGEIAAMNQADYDGYALLADGVAAGLQQARDTAQAEAHRLTGELAVRQEEAARLARARETLAPQIAALIQQSEARVAAQIQALDEQVATVANTDAQVQAVGKAGGFIAFPHSRVVPADLRARIIAQADEYVNQAIGLASPQGQPARTGKAPDDTAAQTKNTRNRTSDHAYDVMTTVPGRVITEEQMITELFGEVNPQTISNFRVALSRIRTGKGNQRLANMFRDGGFTFQQGIAHEYNDANELVETGRVYRAIPTADAKTETTAETIDGIRREYAWHNVAQGIQE